MSTTKTNSARFAVGLILSISLIVEVYAQNNPPLADSSFVPGEVYVQFVDGLSLGNVGRKTGSRVFDDVADRYQFSAVKKTFPALNKVARKTDKISALGRIYTIYFNESYSPGQVASALALDPNVVYAEPKLIRYIREQDLSIKPNDPLFDAHQAKYFELLQLPKAWEVAKGEQGDVVIAIVDDGVYWRHEDLLANAWTNPGEVPSNGIDDDQNGYIDDVHGYNFGGNHPYDPREFIHPRHGSHGTSVASMAVAVTDNGIGMAGTSWNARFISVGALCNIGGGVCDATEGMVYAAALGADIINASFGGARSSKTESLAIQAITDMGTLVVAAAGNEGWNVDRRPSYPADYPRVLSVGATSSDYDIVMLNYGTNVDVYAAGRDVTGPHEGGYAHGWNGTSFSSPLVSGIAALVKTAFPTYNADQVREQIRFTADPIDYANVPEFEGLLGFGRVNAFRAVTETGIAGVVLDTAVVEIHSGGWRLGSTGHVRVTVHSYLEGAGDVEINMVKTPDALEFALRTTTVGSIPRGGSKTVTIPFTVVEHPGYRVEDLYVVEVRAGNEVSREAFLHSIEGWEIEGVTSNKLTFDVTSEGNIGWLDRNDAHLYGFSRGRGIHFRETQHLLQEAGLILGTGPDHVSRTVRGIEGVENNIHFRPKPDAGLRIRTPGNIAPWEAEVTLLDTKAPNPIGLEILQETYFDTGSRNSGFAILRYTVTNPTSTAINNLHIGMLFDWLISERWWSDIPGYDSDRGVGFQYTEAHEAPVMGAKVLTDDAKTHFMTYDLGVYPYPQSESAWWFMSGGVNSPQNTASSYWGQVLGTGPYTTVHPGESVEAAFAFFGGNSIDDMLLNADRAQDYWDSRFSSKARVQFLRIDSKVALDLYVNGQLTIEDWHPETATKFLPMESGDSVLELRNTGDSKISNSLASARVDFDPAGSYQVTFFGTPGSTQFIVEPNARRTAVSEDKVEFRAVNGITGSPNVELRVLDGHSHIQISTLQAAVGTVSSFAELEPGPYVIGLWDPVSSVLLGTYNLDTGSYAGRSFVLVMSGSASSGVEVKSFWPDGTELVSAAEVTTVASHILPSELVLHGNYPNPFNSFTQIRFDLPMPAHITVEVMDLIGRRVWQGSEEYIEAGHNRQYRISTDRLASGVYLYRLSANTSSGILTQAGRIVVVK